MWNEFPNTNFHELNLDWILSTIKKLCSELSDFKVINSIKWRGEWDITKQYSIWSIVDVNGNGYISIKNIPSGIEIDNENYWVLVANYSALYADFQNRVIALEENAKTLSKKPLQGKKIILVGDRTINNSWVELLKTVYGAIETIVYTNPSAEYGGTNNMYDLVSNIEEHDADYIILCAGNVDYENQNAIGVRASDEQDYSTIYGGSSRVIAKVISDNPNSMIYATLPLTNREGVGTGHPITQKLYANAICNSCNHRGISTINLHNIVAFKPWMTIYNDLYAIDGAYPNDNYAPFMAQKIAYMLSTNTSDYTFNEDSCYNFDTNIAEKCSAVTVTYERFFCNNLTNMYFARYRNVTLDLTSNNRMVLFDNLPNRLKPYANVPIVGSAQVSGKQEIKTVKGFLSTTGECYISIEGETGTVTITNLYLSCTYPIVYITQN